ncbi:MAG: hypothetical protein AAF432_02330 [Planctomycetota bacterium]
MRANVNRIAALRAMQMTIVIGILPKQRVAACEARNGANEGKPASMVLSVLEPPEDYEQDENEDDEATERP